MDCGWRGLWFLDGGIYGLWIRDWGRFSKLAVEMTLTPWSNLILYW